MKLEQLLRDGAAPNPTNNCTIAEARNLSVFLGELFPIHQIVINTTTSYPIEAAMVPASEFEIPADARLFFALQVNGDDRSAFIGVANIQAVRRNQGDQQAAVLCLEQIVPGWKDVPELSKKVGELLPYVPAPVVVDQPVAAMPDWDVALDRGMLGSRDGDLSKLGTRYTSPAGAIWEKCIRPDTMFGNAWKRVN